MSLPSLDSSAMRVWEANSLGDSSLDPSSLLSSSFPEPALSQLSGLPWSSSGDGCCGIRSETFGRVLEAST